MKTHKKTHNPQRLYFYQAIDESGGIMREYLFWSLEEALIQLEKPNFVKITKKEYDSFNDSDKKKCFLTKQKGKHWQYFKPKTLNK